MRALASEPDAQRVLNEDARELPDHETPPPAGLPGDVEVLEASAPLKLNVEGPLAGAEASDLREDETYGVRPR